MNAIHRLIGMGGDQLVPELLGHDNPKASAARAVQYRKLIGDVRAFPGAVQLLRALHGGGVAVVLATSSPAEELQVLREVLDADDAIDGQTTADDVEESKPAPEVFLNAMRTFSIDPSRTVAVGDSVWDVQAARAAGIGCVTVETGGFSQHELGEAGALRVYRDVEEILDQFILSPLQLLCANR